MMSEPHMNPALVNDPKALRAKLNGLTGVWADRLERIRDEARSEKRSALWYGVGSKVDRPMHAAFLAMATGDREFMDIARRDLAWMADHYDETLSVGYQDNDTWMYAAPMARRALSCDWIWDGLDSGERKRYADLFIRDSLRYPYVVLHHRVPPHANNQGMAQALNLVVIGWIFGIRRGSDPLAKHLLSVGLRHLHQQIALLPPDAYAGEGSTYEVGVSAPLTALAAAVLESITGDQSAETAFAPCGNSFLEALLLAPRLLPPSGVLPGWDQHGFHFSMPNCVRAYLAQRTGDSAWFSPVVHGDGWGNGSRFAWMYDDQIWTMLWMPDPAACVSSSAFPPPWSSPRVGGTLVDSGRLHAFQYWDLVGLLPIRAHCNPNALQLEAFGSLLTVDGNPTEGYRLNDDPRMRIEWWAAGKPATISWAGGSIASHSCVQVDDAIDLRGPDAGIAIDPRRIGAGQLVRHEIDKNWQCIAANAAACYARSFHLHHAIRTTALVEDACWIIRDDLSDSMPHEWTWRLVLRAGAISTPWGFRLTTAEHVVLDGIALDGSSGEVVDIDGFPSVLEKRCHHWLRRGHGASQTFLTLLWPRLAREPIAEFGRIPACTSAWEADLDLPEGGDLLLELPRTYGLEATLDGAPLHIPALGQYQNGEPICMSPFIPLPRGPARRARLSLRITIGELDASGRVALHRSRPIPPPRWQRDGDLLTIGHGPESISVDLRRLQTAPPPSTPFTATGEDPIATAENLIARLGLDADLDWTGLGGESGCIAGLSDPSWDTRLRAAAWLARHGTNAALAALHSRLAAETPSLVADKTYEPRYRIKELCLLAIHRLRDRSAKPLLEGMLDRHEFYGVRRLAARALADLGDASSLPALQRWINDADMETACAAVAAIEQINAGTRR